MIFKENVSIPKDCFDMTHEVFLKLNTLKESCDLQNLFNIDHHLPFDLKKHYKAFIHSSFVHDFKGNIESNERLEFLGDTVLGLLISEMLFFTYPKLDEGKLSKFRASLVNEEKLYHLALANKLYRLIVFGRGLVHNDNLVKQGPLADMVEAVLGSIYEQEGIEEAKKFLKALLENYKSWAKQDYLDPKMPILFDPKSTLQEKVVSLYGILPEYRAKEIDHQLYRIDLFINERKILTGEGGSKKKIQKELASTALKKRLYL